MPPAEALPVLDRAHLARQTMGDEALARELTAMLLAQLDEAGHAMTGMDEAERARLAHRLTGAAANLGAFRLAEAGRGLADEGGGPVALDGFLAEARALASLLRGG